MLIDLDNEESLRLDPTKMQLSLGQSAKWLSNLTVHICTYHILDIIQFIPLHTRMQVFQCKLLMSLAGSHTHYVRMKGEVCIPPSPVSNTWSDNTYMYEFVASKSQAKITFGDYQPSPPLGTLLAMN